MVLRTNSLGVRLDAIENCAVPRKIPRDWYFNGCRVYYASTIFANKRNVHVNDQNHLCIEKPKRKRKMKRLTFAVR